MQTRGGEGGGRGGEGEGRGGEEEEEEDMMNGEHQKMPE